ncbi:hypothetical protein L7F22_010841 [Adiantum nelumboides]|nr:hypothetical protein [Adiantum nelumboides]
MRFSHTSSVMIKTLLILGTIFVDHLHFSCGAGMFPQQLQLAPDCDNSSISSMRCPNLGNISLPSPFILDELKSCIPNVSADFVLTNCNSNSNVSAPIQQAAFWQSFTQALPPQDVQRGLIGPPAVIGLTSDAPQSANPYIHVNLTWDSSLMRPQYLPSINSGSPSFAPLACRRPHSSTNLSHYFPTSINLTKLYYAANNQVSISSNTKFLLFNCSNKILYKSTADKYDLQQRLRVVDSTSLCQLYKDSCSSNLTAMFGVVPKCYELQYGTDDTELVDSYYVDETVLSYLSLQSIIDNMSCTHSEVFVVSSSGGSDQIAGVEQWLPGVMQLLFIKPQCSFCQGYKSSECVYSASNRNNPGCNCTSKEGGQSVLLDAGSCIFSYYGKPILLKHSALLKIVFASMRGYHNPIYFEKYLDYVFGRNRLLAHRQHYNMWSSLETYCHIWRDWNGRLAFPCRLLLLRLSVWEEIYEESKVEKEGTLGEAACGCIQW